MGSSNARREARKRKFHDRSLNEDKPLPTDIIQPAESFSTTGQQASRSPPSQPQTLHDDFVSADVSIDKDVVQAEQKDTDSAAGEVSALSSSQPVAETTTSGADKSKAQRFIVFVGNLPYKTTLADLTAHFATVRPSRIRHRTDPTTGRSKGFAFVEFDAYDRMKTCLKLFHHSNFVAAGGSGDAGKGGAAGGGTEEGGGDGDGDKKNTKKKKNKKDDDGKARRINVELTAGGGGTKSAHRKHKLKTKNAKLNEERKRRGVGATAATAAAAGGTDAAATGEEKARGEGGPPPGLDPGAGDVHPSRRNRVPGGRGG